MITFNLFLLLVVTFKISLNFKLLKTSSSYTSFFYQEQIIFDSHQLARLIPADSYPWLLSGLILAGQDKKHSPGRQVIYHWALIFNYLNDSIDTGNSLCPPPSTVHRPPLPFQKISAAASKTCLIFKLETCAADTMARGMGPEGWEVCRNRKSVWKLFGVRRKWEGRSRKPSG